MNGHHETCECADCTKARECGMDRALELLSECEEYFDGRSDIDNNGAPNAEMRLLLNIRDLLAEHGADK